MTKKLILEGRAAVINAVLTTLRDEAADFSSTEPMPIANVGESLKAPAGGGPLIDAETVTVILNTSAAILTFVSALIPLLKRGDQQVLVIKDATTNGVVATVTGDTTETDLQEELEEKGDTTETDLQDDAE